LNQHLGIGKSNEKESKEGIDPLIQLLKSKPKVLELLGRIWELLYIEGSTPDIGKRREHVIRIMLEEELKLKVLPAPPMEREWDFSIMIEGEERRYSLKTTEDITTIKVAWNGYPSIERAQRFEFKYPILYICGNRKKGELSVYVFDVDDLVNLKKELGNSMWWIPKSNTNPRGFGIDSKAVKVLIGKAMEKDNFVTVRYQHIDINTVEKKYWKSWYCMLKELASEGFI